MYFILLITLMTKIVLGDDESYEKYIDLLPEEEKQEFLDRIARRILEGIKTEKLSNPNQPNVEITDAQLDAQDAYVQDILKEETERLEDEKKQDDSLRTEDGNRNGDENKYIDLTLREGKNTELDRETETTTEFPYNVIPVKTIYDDPNDDPIRTVNNKLKENVSMRIKHEINDYINVNESNNDPTFQLTEDAPTPQSLNNSKNENNLRKSFRNYISSVSTSTDFENDMPSMSTSTYFDQNFAETSTVTEQNYKESSETTIKIFEENLNNVTSDKVIQINNFTSNENDLNTEVNTERQNAETTTIVSNLAITISTEQPKNLNEEEGNNDHESTTLTIGENTTIYNDINTNQKFQRSGVDEIISTSDIPRHINKTNTDSLEFSTQLTENLSVNKSDNVENYNVTENKVEPEITSISSNVSTTSKSEDIKNITQTNEGTSEEKVIEPKKDLHLRSSLKESKEEILWANLSDPKPRKEKTYEVFEVAAEKPPFKLLHKVEIDKPKHYVPIYDYAPENAYYRPYERFGPDFRNLEQENIQNYLSDENSFNEDKNDFNIPQMRSRFSSYNNKPNSQYRLKDTHYPIKKENSEMYAFMRPVPTRFVNNLYNPYDYLDMDYANGRYILRSVHEPNFKPFPDSNEPDHPYNSIHKSDSVKDHIRAVRKLLYLQKRFGYVPEVDKEMRKFDQKAKTLKFPIKKAKEGVFNEPVKDKISADYYFERANSREDPGNVARVNSTQGEIFIVPKEIVEEFDAVLNSNDKRHSSSPNSFERELEKRKFSSFFYTMLDVLADMVRFDNEALEGYDWLRTSVDIQSGVRKLSDLTESLKDGKKIHPKDLELLKYCLYIFKSSQMSSYKYGRQNKIDLHVKRRKKKGLLPQNWKKNKHKQPLLQWKDFAKFIRNHVENEQKLKILYDFEDFLRLILYHLNEFHDAIKHIAMITKFNNQKWYLDLKQIYFKEATRRQLGNVLLHLCVFTLLDRLEADAVNISEVNFRLFVENNLEDVRSTRKDFVFVLRVVEELNRINV